MYKLLHSQTNRLKMKKKLKWKSA